MNIGVINWNNNAAVYGVSGSSTFAGIDPFVDTGADSLLADAIGESLNNFLDSAGTSFEFSGATDDQYSTALPARIFISANYDLLEKLSVGAGWTGEIYRGRFNQTLLGNVSFKPVHWFTVGTNLSLDNRYRALWGFQTRFNMKFFQFYGGTSNALAPFMLGNLRAWDFFLGMNLTFGRKAIFDKKNSSQKDDL